MSTHPTGAPTPSPSPERRRRRWAWPAVTAGAMVLGIAAGGSSSGAASSDALDAATAERDVLAERLEQAQGAARRAEGELTEQEAAFRTRAAELDEREAALDERSAALDGREAAITQTEETVAAGQVDIGTWTVGVDIQPGTYRTAEAVTSTCYWGIYRSGTNGDDIIQNDIVQGGFPTVTLQEGQDFENGCGVFVKQ